MGPHSGIVVGFVLIGGGVIGSMRSDDPEAIDLFKAWLDRNGPSRGTANTYYAAMRTYIRVLGGKIDRATVRSDADIERIRQQVEEAIARDQSPINIYRLQRALIPGLNHYAEFARQSLTSIRATSKPAKITAGAGFTMADIKAFAARYPGRPIKTIGEETEFTLRVTPGGVAVEPTKARNPIYVPESREFFARFNALQSFTTTRYLDVSFHVSYLLATIREILAERMRPPAVADIPVDELEVMAAPETEREALRKSRVGQGKYRDDLLNLRGTCYVTGLNDARFLRASHILPWKDSDNAQRLDAHNGLLLSPHYDALFNDGFISFQDDGHIMVSRRLPLAVIEAFRLPLDFVGADLGQRTKEYLAIHRQKVFQSPVR